MTTLDDIEDAVRRSEWGAIIECEQCGHSGVMESTHKPRDQTVWHCDRCDEETVYRTMIKNDEWRDLDGH